MIIKDWKDMNQWERAHTIIESMRSISMSRTSTTLEKLDGILGDAQNRPPDGGADGSINPEAWYALRELADFASAYMEALKKARVTFVPDFPKDLDDYA